MIPANNDTYFDVAAMDNTDLTAVTKNFLHSCFSQCSIDLNDVTLTQASDLYSYLSYFETILT